VSEWTGLLKVIPSGKYAKLDITASPIKGK